VVKCFGFALHQVHNIHLGWTFVARIRLSRHSKCCWWNLWISRNLCLTWVGSKLPTTVIQFQYVARHSGHSYADVTKFHLHFQSLDFALLFSIGLQHQLPKFNSACCSH
jgi:hypothetical protein